MCLLTSAVELLVSSSPSKFPPSPPTSSPVTANKQAAAPKPPSILPPRLVATAFLLYGIALIFGATGTTQIYQIARLAPVAQNQALVLAALALMLVGILFKVSAAPSTSGRRRLRRRALARRRSDVHRSQSRRLRSAPPRGL